MLSGFSIDHSVRIYPTNEKVKENLCEYIVRAPISLQKIIYEPFKGKVIVHTQLNNYLKENMWVVDAEEFIDEVTQHIPPRYLHLTRYYGLYSSRTREKWKEMTF